MTDLFLGAINFILHIGDHLTVIIQQYGTLTYAIVFGIVFLETGLVITPFLPGDSLIFAAAAIAAQGHLDVIVLWVLFVLGAVLGDALNYWIGHAIGPRIFKEQHRFLSEKHLLQTKDFYERHGGKTIILARFMPFIRTFAPFVAGIARMPYRKFFVYNVAGGILWVSLFLGLGYFFGNLPFVRKNFSELILIIIALSVVPPLVKYIKEPTSK